MDTMPTKERKKPAKDTEKPVVARTAYDLQRLKLMKLMKNPDKPVLLPDRPKSKNSPSVPEFVRNVMGSSAGAGSGEFHVYRHLRRKEYSRQKFIQDKGRKETLDDEYHEKLLENKLKAEQTTAKKRAKRLKKNQKQKQMKKLKPSDDKVDREERNRCGDSQSDSDSSANAEDTKMEDGKKASSSETVDGTTVVTATVEKTIGAEESKDNLKTEKSEKNVILDKEMDKQSNENSETTS